MYTDEEEPMGEESFVILDVDLERLNFFFIALLTCDVPSNKSNSGEASRSRSKDGTFFF